MKTKKSRSCSRRIASALVISLVVHIFALIPLLVSILSNDAVPSDDEQARRYEVEIYERELEESFAEEQELVKNTEDPEDFPQKSPQKEQDKTDEISPPREKPKKEKPEPRKPQKKQSVELKDKKLEFRKKMVHQETPEEEEAPDDFRFYAEKNRNVEKETRAEKTQLTMVESKKHQLLKEKEKIAETISESKTPDEQKKTKEEKEQSRKKSRKTREQKKQEAEEAQKRALEKRSEERKKKQEQETVLSMRRSVDTLPKKLRSKTSRDKTGEIPVERKAMEREREATSKSSSPGERRLVDIEVRPTTRALQQLFGKEWAEEYERTKDSERHAQKGRASAHPSEKRWKEIRAGIENYIAEVRPGRVTSLRTRANPFAKYISAVHRKIHPLWGDGFLVDWSGKDPDDPMNKRDRWAMVEMVVNGDGTLHKAGLVKSSGYLPYDAAAMDVVFSAAPFVRAPEKIRSADGRVYMHWRFHRNHRQCGTFGVDAYILTAPEKESGINKATADRDSDTRTPDSVEWDPARSFKQIPARKQKPDD